jgi:hypothetical protein
MEKKRKTIEKRIDDFVFDSENQVEKYYKVEKQKAKDILDELERKKAVSLVNIAKKQLLQVRNENHNLHVIHNDLKNHINNISKKIKEINNEKEINKKNIDNIPRLKKSLRKLEREEAGFMNVRKELVTKEKIIIDKINDIVNKNKSKLKVSDKDKSDNLSSIEEEKQRLIKEAKTLLIEEKYELYADNDVIDSIGKIAQFRIKRLNKKLKELKKIRLNVLKQIQLLELNEEKAREKIRACEKKLNHIKNKYKRILGIK